MAMAYPKPSNRHTILMGVVAGASFPAQRYITQLNLFQMTYHYAWWSILLSCLCPIIAFIILLRLAFVPKSTWVSGGWRTIGLSILIAILLCFSAYISIIGTTFYPVAPVDFDPATGYASWTSDGSTPFLAPSISFFSASCVFLLIVAVFGKRAQIVSRSRNNVNRLALARFDFTGRILLTPYGTLPLEVIRDPYYPEEPWGNAIQGEDMEFRWLWRVARFWSEIAQHTGHLFTAWQTEDDELERRLRRKGLHLPWSKITPSMPEIKRRRRRKGDLEDILEREEGQGRSYRSPHFPNGNASAHHSRQHSTTPPSAQLNSQPYPNASFNTSVSSGLPDRLIRAAMTLSQTMGIQPNSLGYLHDYPLKTDSRQARCQDCQRETSTRTTFPDGRRRSSSMSSDHLEGRDTDVKSGHQTPPSAWNLWWRRLYKGKIPYLTQTISMVFSLLPSTLQPFWVERPCPIHQSRPQDPLKEIMFRRKGRILVLCSIIQEHAEIIALTFQGYKFHDPIPAASILSRKMGARRSEMMEGMEQWYTLALSTQKNVSLTSTLPFSSRRFVDDLRSLESGDISSTDSIITQPRPPNGVGVVAWILRGGPQHSLEILAPSSEPHALPSVPIPGCTLQELYTLWAQYEGGWGKTPLSLLLTCLQAGDDPCRQGVKEAVEQLIKDLHPLALEKAQVYAHIVEWYPGYPCIALYLFLITDCSSQARWRHPWFGRQDRPAPCTHPSTIPKHHTWVPWNLWRVMHHTVLHHQEIDQKIWSLAIRQEYGPLRLVLHESYGWSKEEVDIFLRMEEFIQDRLQTGIRDAGSAEDILVNMQLIDEGMIPGEWWEHPVPNTRMYTTGYSIDEAREVEAEEEAGEGEPEDERETETREHSEASESSSPSPTPSLPPLRGDPRTGIPSTSKIIDRMGYGDWWTDLMRETLSLERSLYSMVENLTEPRET